MNAVYPLALYAVIQKKIGGDLAYPGTPKAFDRPQDQSTAFLNAYLEEWAVLNPACANQAFNAADGSSFSWGKFWPKLANHYGLECGFPNEDLSEYQTITAKYDLGQRG